MQDAETGMLVLLHATRKQTFKDSRQQGGSTANDLTQRLDLLLVLHQPPFLSHDPIKDLKDSSEPTRCALDLLKAGNGHAHFDAMLKHDEELDAEGHRLDIQRVVLVDTRINAVVLTRVLQVANTVALPFLEERDELLTCTAARDGETEELRGRLDVEEARKPRTLWSRAGHMS
jgi:hypothetical protein